MKVRIDFEDWKFGRMAKHDWENPVRGDGEFKGYEAKSTRGTKYFVCPLDEYYPHRAANKEIGEQIANVYEVRNKDWKKVAEIDGNDIELVN